VSSPVEGADPVFGSALDCIDDVAGLGLTRSAPTSVLIVGDAPDERARVRSMLETVGHRIVEASPGAEARRCVTSNEFAVVVLDIRAADVEGFETAAFIRSRASSKETPIVFVTTAERSERDMAAGYEIATVDFIVAPIVPVALRAKVLLFADLVTKTHELRDRAQRLHSAAASSTEALAFQLEMLDRMETLGRAKSDFVSRISHELRSPLTSVIGYIELLVDGGPGEPNAEQLRMFAIIERNSRRLLALIEDLLTMSRAEAGTFELEVGPVDVRELVARVAETVAPSIARADLQLVVDLDAAVGLTADSDQLERALLNLVSNAVKFTPPGGEIEISSCVEGDDLALSVRDTGSGIPSEEQERLFTRFFRSTQAKEQQVAGTGLGLYIVKQIIELHGGTIDVSSTPAGSTFRIRVPVSGPPADPLALVRRR
jgi:signal transduction histidine kinase